ncbi:Protein CBR-HHAT-1 [Caenorhabditis briggsae]|uniref:Protein CBR-HHAT-1 n=2 Tax=Caenorhabditis briggsae TaxID=6238 RepID=A8XCB8_CAEBR|nr:Protein CBR-HHAT-1 [Caenorhabditis briggsae]ULU04743.1 hypothetical protein L3Y34_017479 [Caenorhabditis briggsae]CAP30285.1 Protein CBR-HHAT-1 [Caenorhabditis briggsae]
MTASTSSKPPARVKPQLFEYPPLKEIPVCFAVTVCTMAYAWYGVYRASQDFKWSIGDYGIWSTPPVIGNLTGPMMKDVTNWEWSRWSPFAWSYLPVFFGHFLLFNTGSAILPEIAFIPIYTLASIGAVSYYFTPFLVGVSIAQGSVVFLTATYVGKTWAVWLSALPVLYVSMHETNSLSDDPFLIFTFLSYSMIHYISYSLEHLKGNSRKEDDSVVKRFVRMMFYAFYQPYLFSLIMLYPDFERQIRERNTRQRNWLNCIWSGVRIAFWWWLMETSLHFLYQEAILKNAPYLYSLPKDQFVALGMAMGIFFHLKYAVIFGLPSLFAKLDNMDPLPGPICLIRVTLYSKVWREFDRGLYQFFKTYIFIPICAPTFSLPRKIFGVFISYGFVLLWHGFYHHNIVWIGLNILALFIEMGSKSIYTIESVRKWREANLSDVALRRILAWCHILPFAIGLYSNFYFLGGSDVGAAFVQRFLIEETITVRWPFLLIISLGWFHANTCMEVDRLKNLKDSKKTKSE